MWNKLEEKLSEMRQQALEEMEKASRVASVWLILKEQKLGGRITLRWTKAKSGRIAHIAFFMYSVEDKLVPIGAKTTMYGYGYDKFSFGIGEILAELKPLLVKYYGIKFDCLDWDIMNKWQSSFKEAGYEIIQAL
ncbi:MAG: hypothetical protein IJ587_01360 [Synergistaceae bacterium]|nr:hypothetical protein [Synergistaceae bacterium]